MNRIYYWVFKKEEFTSLITIFSSIFETADLYRDYEDTWEWIEGDSKSLQAGINIRREHNWETGLYEKPIQICLTFDKENTIKDELIEDLGRKLSIELNEAICYGIITYTNREYDLRLIKKFEPLEID